MVKFKCTEEGLYAFNPTKGFYEEVAARETGKLPVAFQGLETVKENMQGYTKKKMLEPGKLENCTGIFNAQAMRPLNIC